MRKPIKKPPPTKYEKIGVLLGNFGNNRIDQDRFWREMKANGYTQDDIDWWCDQYIDKCVEKNTR